MTDSNRPLSVPSSMKVAIYRSRGKIDVEFASTPTLAADDVLLRISHCGICGTDLHLVMEGWGRPNSIGGHEYSGKVVALGSAVSGWAIGDAAVGGPGPRCGILRNCAWWDTQSGWSAPLRCELIRSRAGAGGTRGLLSRRLLPLHPRLRTWIGGGFHGQT